MDTQTVATTLAQGATGFELRFLLLWLALTIVGASGGSFLYSYLSQRGKNYATKQDFDDLTEQLKETTRVAESVRSDIAHADWTAREWKALRRVKAEEFVLELQRVIERYREMTEQYLFRDMKRYESLETRTAMIAQLYFPEALPQTMRFCALSAEGVHLLLDIRQEMNRANETIEFSSVRARRLPEVHTLNDDLEDVAQEISEIVRSVFWETFNLSEYVHDLALVEKNLGEIHARQKPVASQQGTGG